MKARATKPGYNKGLDKGFVRFGSTAHAVLLHVHQHDKVTMNDVIDGVDDDKAAFISFTLTRLCRLGFVHRIGCTRYKPGARSVWVYALTPPAKPVLVKSKAGGAVRSRAYRAKLAVRVPSVFEWRGSMTL